MVTYGLKLTFLFLFPTTVLFGALKYFFFLKRDFYVLNMMDVSYPTIQCTYDGIQCSFSISLSSFYPSAHNVNHFTGLSRTSSRNVMEMFYLREGYR